MVVKSMSVQFSGPEPRLLDEFKWITGRQSVTSVAQAVSETGGFLTTGSLNSVYGYYFNQDEYVYPPVFTADEFRSIFL